MLETLPLLNSLYFGTSFHPFHSMESSARVWYF
jgi:hypothetical protein